MIARNLLVKVGLAAVLAGLIAWNGSLDAAEREARETSQRIGRLIEKEQRDTMVVAAVSLGFADGRELLYGRAGGVWRCFDHHGAVASAEAVSSLVTALLEAEGVVQSADRARAPEYGIDTEQTIRVTLHGPQIMQDPDRDVLFQLDVGDELKGLDGCFVRRPDVGSVWSIDTNPRATLAVAPGREGPPLLDPGVVPAVWPGEGRRTETVTIERADGVVFQLGVRPIEITEEQAMRGSLPFEWVVREPGGRETLSHPILATTFHVFLRQVPWQAVVDPQMLADFGFEAPRGRVVLQPNDGSPPLTLVVGPTLPDGTAVVLNTGAQTAYRVEAGVADGLLPDPESLIDKPGASPWDDYVK